MSAASDVYKRQDLFVPPLLGKNCLSTKATTKLPNAAWKRWVVWLAQSEAPASHAVPSFFSSSES
eukprot:3862227-Amphidinium_carterae.1